MNFPSTEFDDAVAALCHGTVSDQALAELHELLRIEKHAQDEYLWRVEVHGELASRSLDFSRTADIDETDSDLEAIATPPVPATIERRWNIQSTMVAAALLAIVALAGGLLLRQNARPTAAKAETVARFADLHESRWMDPTTQVSSGDAVLNGQRIELSSGTAKLLFNTGARLRIVGPTIVEPRTDNSVYLTMGEVHLVAETPEAKGFTVVTQNSKFVDIGTAFSATVAPDGLSRLEVSEGEVDVVFNGIEHSSQLRAGETMYVEPGEQKIVTRIEPGDGTSAFQFPTIGSPSASDYADQSQANATIRVVQGQLRSHPGQSGAATVLLDGTGQSQQDAPGESAFFQDRAYGSFLVDLGEVVNIFRINSYSWHQHNIDPTHRSRAQQRFTLYGFSGDELPDSTLPPDEAGWTRIARVNSDRRFKVRELLDRPAQQACSISSADGDIGRFRYLLWEVKRNTFFGEFDVFVSSSQAVRATKGE